MSITSDLRSYADTAVNQGKQVLDTAQSQLNDVTGQANEFYGKTKENVSDIAEKATETVNDLRAQAEKAINVEAIKSAIEPYVAQIKGYTSTVTEKAEELIAEAKKDKRVAQLFDAAGVVVEQVQEHVVKPVQSLTGIGVKPAPTPARKPVAKTTPAKPAAASTSTAKPTTARAKPTARKPAAKRTAKS